MDLKSRRHLNYSCGVGRVRRYRCAHMLSDTVSRGGCRNEYRCECGSVWLVSTLSPRVIYEWGPWGLGEMADSRLQTGKVQGASEVSSRAKKQLRVCRMMGACQSKGHGRQLPGAPTGPDQQQSEHYSK